ncbi:lytic murein transglycosylase [Paracoccaceae bacterium]|nr:lytic murein transglycosylase [Paracoccaceae bacterium]
MKSSLKTLAFLLIFSLPSVVLGKTFTNCGGDFNGFLKEAERYAIGIGVSTEVVKKTIRRAKFNPNIIKLDRQQRSFKLSFLDFSKRAINDYRLVNGKKKFKKYRAVFDKALAVYGVPKEVITAFWAMETDFGAVQGDFNTLNSLASLAFDCRRPELFQPEFIAAIQLIERGDIDYDTTGAWAGEIGQVQMLPQDILEFGIDGNKDGQISLKETPEDAILTAANLINHMGWVKGEAWLEEVILPKDFYWELAGFRRGRALKDWHNLGLQLRKENLEIDENLYSTLLLPQGKKGPAFLAFENFEVYLKWNDSFIYTVTAAHLAKRLGGAKKYKHNNPSDILDLESMIILQNVLRSKGYDVGKVDGILGAKTRQAVRSVQLEFGLSADSWPTKELLKKLLVN